MEKTIWYFFGVVLLTIAIISLFTAINTNCFPYDDYGFYMYCSNFKSNQFLEALISSIASMWCFSMGGNNE